MRCLHRLGAALALVAIVFVIGHGAAATGTADPAGSASMASPGTPNIDWP
jgi:hypothetical protein